MTLHLLFILLLFFSRPIFSFGLGLHRCLRDSYVVASPRALRDPYVVALQLRDYLLRSA